MSGRDEREALPPGFAHDVATATPVDRDALARVRAASLDAFRAQAGQAAERAAAGQDQTAPAPAVPVLPGRDDGRRPVRRTWWAPLLRPASAAGFAAVMVAASFGLVAANSGPGDAFYGVRLAAEELNLPFLGAGSSSERTLDRLRQRLDEAQQEAGDPAAIAAALRAYQDELRRALADASDEPTRQRILAALGIHETVLDALSQTAPEAADPGIQQARDQVGEARANLRAGLPSVPPAPAPSTAPSAGTGPPPTGPRDQRNRVVPPGDDAHGRPHP